MCSIGETYYDSLEDAVNSAAANDTSTIHKSLTTNSLAVNKTLTINVADDVDSIKISRAVEGNLITVSAGTLVINGGGKLSFDGGDFTQNGSLISLQGGAAELNGVAFADNFNSNSGGAVYSNVGTLKLSGCTIENCCGSYGGGVVIGAKSTVSITDSIIENCSASVNGGGINNLGGGIISTLKGTVIKNNTAANGGGIWTDGYSVIDNAEITGDTAAKLGGGVYYEASNSARKMQIKGSTFEGNNAGVSGNAIYMSKQYSDMAITDASFIEGISETGKTVQDFFISQAAAVSISGTELSQVAFPEGADVSVSEKKSDDSVSGITITRGTLTVNITYKETASGEDAPVMVVNRYCSEWSNVKVVKTK